MIIDFHVHIAIESQGMWTPDTWVLFKEYYRDKYDDFERYGQHPHVFREYLESQGLDKCVLLAENSNQTGIVPNDYILEYCEEEPDFFIPFLAMNPNKTECYFTNPDRFKKNVRYYCDQLAWLAEKGFKGIKDYSSYNYFPIGAELMYPFYETAAGLGLPVLFHTGESLFDSDKSRSFASPEGLGDLAKTFRDLVTIIGHAGSGKYFPVAYELVKTHPNIYLELSGVPPHRIQKHFFDQALDLNIIPDKLVFGSDYPAIPKGLDGIRMNLETYRKQVEDSVLSKESLDGLLGLNAARILGL